MDKHKSVYDAEFPLKIDQKTNSVDVHLRCNEQRNRNWCDI